MPETAVVLIEFDAAKARSFRNSMMSHRSIIKNYGGRLVGVGEQLNTVDGPAPRGSHWRALGVLAFGSMAEAGRWVDSDNAAHQPDFMDGAEIVVAPCKGEIFAGCWCQLMDLERTDPAGFDQYAREHMAALSRVGAVQPVATVRADHRRGMARPGLLVLEQFPEHSAWRDMVTAHEYSKVEEMRRRSSHGRVVCFQLDPMN